MDQSKYPDRFWHCNVITISVETKGKSTEREAFANDMSMQQLDEQIVVPWHRNDTFIVDGLVVKSRESVKEIKIIHTAQDSRFYFS